MILLQIILVFSLAVLCLCLIAFPILCIIEARDTARFYAECSAYREARRNNPEAFFSAEG